MINFKHKISKQTDYNLDQTYYRIKLLIYGAIKSRYPNILKSIRIVDPIEQNLLLKYVSNRDHIK
jgi:hypothetical protein